MQDRLVKCTRFLALAIWLAAGAGYFAAPVAAEEELKCKDVCDGCDVGNCKACATIGDATCWDPKAELE